MSGTIALKELLSQHTMPSAPQLAGREDGSIRCLACGHRCRIQEGKAGVCRVRFVRTGELRVPAGYVAGLQIDPIGKTPFYHAYPGRDALSFGMLGCDLHCSYCQNWITSQALRDDQAVAMPRFIRPEQIVELAVKHRTPVMVSTYNEPLITADWAVEVFRLARQHGIVCGFVSNGNATPECLEFIRPYVDLYKIDLKCFNDGNYRRLGAPLENILSTIRLVRQMGFWTEIVTLIVPTFNDSDEELKQIAGFLAGVSPEIPWHVTAFHPDYKMTGAPATPVETLLRAYEIGRAAGLKFVYAGNAPGAVGDRENTYCPGCRSLLIRRYGFHVEKNRMQGGRCPDCGARIPGVWEAGATKVSEGTSTPLRVPSDRDAS